MPFDSWPDEGEISLVIWHSRPFSSSSAAVPAIKPFNASVALEYISFPLDCSPCGLSCSSSPLYDGAGMPFLCPQSPRDFHCNNGRHKPKCNPSECFWYVHGHCNAARKD